MSPSAALPPADFKAEKARLDAKFGIDATPEDVISSLLYPKVPSSQSIGTAVQAGSESPSECAMS